MDNENKRITVAQASKILGMSPMSVRVRMSRNLFNPPIGRVIKSMQGKRDNYLIFEDMLSNYIRGGCND